MVKFGTRNLIPYPYYHTTRTIKGITFTDNGDGSITVNGTATADAYFYLTPIYNGDYLQLASGTYMYSRNATSDNIRIGVDKRQISDNTYIGRYLPNVNTDSTFTISESDIGLYYPLLMIYIQKGLTVENETIYPQLEVGTVAHDYEPYEVELQNHIFNGQEVNTWIHNGVQVFSIASEPFYVIQNGVIQSGFPTSYHTSTSSNVNYIRNSLTQVYIGTASQTTTANFTGYTDLIDTKNNKYMNITVTIGSNSANTPLSMYFRNENNEVVGTTLTTSGTYTIDISNASAIRIWINVTCWAESASYISISSLKFDNVRTLKQSSYTSDIGSVIYSSELSSTYAVWKAFDGNNSTLGAAGTSANPYIGYQFNDAKTIKNVSVDLAYTHGTGTNYTLSFKLQYLNNGLWVDIPDTNVTDTFVGGSWTEKHYEWKLSNIKTSAIRLTEYSGSSWAMFIRNMEIQYK